MQCLASYGRIADSGGLEHAFSWRSASRSLAWKQNDGTYGIKEMIIAIGAVEQLRSSFEKAAESETFGETGSLFRTSALLL